MTLLIKNIVLCTFIFQDIIVNIFLIYYFVSQNTESFFPLNHNNIMWVNETQACYHFITVTTVTDLNLQLIDLCPLQHYKNCHGIGIYQCLYCLYGAYTERQIRTHLCYKHSNAAPKAIHRTSSLGNEKHVSN